MKYEVDKYYKLDPNQYYWCINIQQKVKFEKPPIIQLKHFLWTGDPFSGYLVDQGGGGFGRDYLTNVEIELANNCILGEYEFQNEETIHFMDFPYIENKGSE